MALQSQLDSSTEQLGGCETRAPDLWCLSSLVTFLSAGIMDLLKVTLVTKLPEQRYCTTETEMTGGATQRALPPPTRWEL